jgi:hypothetical protein
MQATTGLAQLHTTHFVLAGVFFVLGQAMHMLVNIDSTVRDKTNPATSHIELIKQGAIPLVSRLVWNLAVFALILEGEFVAILHAMSIPVPGVLTALLDLHVGAAIAWLAGYSFDSLLAYVPKLKTYTPPDPTAPVSVTPPVK